MSGEEELERELDALRARERRTLRRTLFLFAAALVVLPVWSANGHHVRSVVRGEMDLDGAPRYEPTHETSPEALAAIDFERVHERLIPGWSVALANATSPYWRRRADEQFSDLSAAVAADPNLRELLGRTHAALREDPIANARRLDYWLWAYNDYLDARGVPWRVEASLTLGARRAVFNTLSYEVMADARNDAGHRLRLLRRADRINTLEGWMGHAGRSEDGAMVLMRRVLHFTVRHVWPGLHPALDERRPPAERSWLPQVREEVRAQLDEETYRLLQETAVDQQALIEITAQIEARRACGSRFVVHDLPYNGLTRADRDALQRGIARSEANPECPEVTLDEAAGLIGASERLGDTEGIESAVERLAMVVARAVGAHELRHVADGEDIPCPGCPDGLEGVARAEVSAYLSAFATEGLGYLGLFQSCATPRGEGVHGAARQAVIDALLPYGCEGPPLHGLYVIAREIEVALFGERPSVALPELPARVELLPRRVRAPRAEPYARPLEGGWGLDLRRPE